MYYFLNKNTSKLVMLSSKNVTAKIGKLMRNRSETNYWVAVQRAEMDLL